MIVQIRQWYSARTLREQRLLLLMVVIALPLLAWLLVVAPLSRAYDSALERHLQAVDRNARVRSLAAAAGRAPPAPARTAVSADFAVTITEAAAQSGLVMDSVSPLGPNAVSVSGSQVPARTAMQWLRDLEGRGVRVEELRMTPGPNGTATLTARLVRNGG